MSRGAEHAPDVGLGDGALRRIEHAAINLPLTRGSGAVAREPSLQKPNRSMRRQAALRLSRYETLSNDIALIAP